MVDYSHCNFEDGWLRGRGSRVPWMALHGARPTPLWGPRQHPVPLYIHVARSRSWTMLWRRLLMWCSLPNARSACQTPQARRSRCTRSRTTLTRSGSQAWMRHATSFRTTIMVVGSTWCDMPTTYSSYITTPSTLLLDSGAVSVVMQGKSNPLSRRLSVWSRSTVPCTSIWGLLRVAFMTRTKSFWPSTITQLSVTRSYFSNAASCTR
jgi:hypothetical protein